MDCLEIISSHVCGAALSAAALGYSDIRVDGRALPVATTTRTSRPRQRPRSLPAFGTNLRALPAVAPALADCLLLRLQHCPLLLRLCA